jgi:hypothetical protein
LLLAALVLGLDADARLSAPPAQYWESKRVVVPARQEQPPAARTATFVVPCGRPGYTAVGGHAPSSDPDIVLVASHAVPPAWSFELTNYGRGPAVVLLEVLCEQGGTPPPRYHLVVRSFTLQPERVRKADVQGPRFTLPLGFGYRVRPLRGTSPPAGDSRVEVLTARPHGRGYEVQLRNTGSMPVRVEVRALLVRTRAGNRTVASSRVVSVTRSVSPGQWVDATARCPAGSAASAWGWSVPVRQISRDATFAGRDFRFRAFNDSDATRRVRFFGVCLNLSASAGRPFSLGASPVAAVGTFANGQGGCPVATSFTDRFLLRAPGDGTLTITQPRTEDEVVLAIAPDGSFGGRNDRESYQGVIAGNRATATYSYTTPTGCIETFDATFELDR